MTENSHLIKNLSMNDLIKSDSEDVFSIVRGGNYLGAFVKMGGTYFFRDNHHNTWVCQCSNIDTGAESIEDAVSFMRY